MRAMSGVAQGNPPSRAFGAATGGPKGGKTGLPLTSHTTIPETDLFPSGPRAGGKTRPKTSADT